MFSHQTDNVCFKELNENKLLNPRYILWSRKPYGADAGVVLHGTRKTGIKTRTFAKRIDYYEGWYNKFIEFLTIVAAKHCGIYAPKIKMVTNGKLFYQFSRDLSDERDNTSFVTLVQLQLRNSELRINKDRTAIHNPVDQEPSYTIDRDSLARLAIGVIIFNLNDLHEENIGVILDNKTKIAKVAFVDNSVDTYIPPSQAYHTSKTLHELVCNYCDLAGTMVNFGLGKLTDDDYQRALAEMSKNMESACQLIASYKENMQLPESLRTDHIDKMINRWKRNLEILNLFAINPMLARMIP